MNRALRVAFVIGMAIGQPSPKETVPIAGYRVVRSYPHRTDAFTEGLLFQDGVLYESTGLWEHSSVSQIDLETGHVIASKTLPKEYFGEGIAIWNATLFQLTWRSNVAFTYDRDSLSPRETFGYSGEGWGITSDGQHLIMSDGSDTLRFLNPATFQEDRRLSVTAAGVPLRLINELEYVRGEIYANVWKTEHIARIDPSSGAVLGYIDLNGLLDPDARRHADVLNGIAYDAVGDRLFVTGKLWPRLFEIKVTPSSDVGQ
jgi:glutaminyl-peptide cyclotransferase